MWQHHTNLLVALVRLKNFAGLETVSQFIQDGTVGLIVDCILAQPEALMPQHCQDTLLRCAAGFGGYPGGVSLPWPGPACLLWVVPASPEVCSSCCRVRLGGVAQSETGAAPPADPGPPHLTLLLLLRHAVRSMGRLKFPVDPDKLVALLEHTLAVVNTDARPVNLIAKTFKVRAHLFWFMFWLA